MAARRARIAKSDQAFRSIGEVAADLGLEPHVIRYWETRFPRDVRPMKRCDGRRMFRPQDIAALRAVQILVHQRGLTLKGAKALLAEQGVASVLSGAATLTAQTTDSPARALQQQVAEAFDASANTETSTPPAARLQDTLVELKGLKARLDAVRSDRAA